MAEAERVGAINQDGISAAISKLMEHPEIIGAVASALSGAEAGADKNDAQAKTGAEAILEPIRKEVGASADAAPDLAASLIPIISRLGTLRLDEGGGGSHGGAGHSALLCALKPYLSKNRSDAIDYMLKISQMSDIISKLR